MGEAGIPEWAGLLVGDLYVELLDKLGLADKADIRARNLPYGDQISKTCLECAAVLIGILEISTVRYKNDLLEQNTWGELAEDYVPPVDVVDHEMDEGEG